MTTRKRTRTKPDFSSGSEFVERCIDKMVQRDLTGKAMFDRDELKYVIPYALVINSKKKTEAWASAEQQLGQGDLDEQDERKRLFLYAERLFDGVVARDQDSVDLLGYLLDQSLTNEPFHAGIDPPRYCYYAQFHKEKWRVYRKYLREGYNGMTLMWQSISPEFPVDIAEILARGIANNMNRYESGVDTPSLTDHLLELYRGVAVKMAKATETDKAIAKLFASFHAPDPDEPPHDIGPDNITRLLNMDRD